MHEGRIFCPYITQFNLDGRNVLFSLYHVCCARKLRIFLRQTGSHSIIIKFEDVRNELTKKTHEALSLNF